MVITPEMGRVLLDTIVGLSLPLRINWLTSGIKCEEIKSRTTDQNSLLHKNFTEIAAFHGDRTMTEAKGQCHLRWGVPIRMRDNQWAWIWLRATDGLTFEQKCKVCESGVFAISSGMTTKELKEYIDALQAEYLPLGARLTIPTEGER
jgi:hypothetical protein